MALVADLARSDDLRTGPAALDSLDQLSVARQVAEFFELEAAGIEEVLLRRTRLSQWSDAIVECLTDGTLTQLWFRTGGTSGEPKLIPQAHGHLLREVREISGLVADTRRIVALVPLHHIYGFIWGPLLSDQLGVPLVHGEAAIETAHQGLAPGDLVLGLPEWWRYFAGAHRRLPAGVRGVTSTAPCPPEVIQAAMASGLSSMIEVYGSSETAGIGWRDNPGQGFRLFKHWTRVDDDQLAAEGGKIYPLPDRVDWQTERSLVPGARRDSAVQVGGVNVWPERVRAFIESHPRVQACAVRPFEADNGTRLRAFIVPVESLPAMSGPDQFKSQLGDWLRANLPPAERPIQLTLGDQLPRNDLGKLCDW